MRLQALNSLQQHAGAPFEVFENVAVEPTEDSFREAIAFARKHDFSHFLACALTSALYSCSDASTASAAGA